MNASDSEVQKVRVESQGEIKCDGNNTEGGDIQCLTPGVSLSLYSVDVLADGEGRSVN